MGESIKKKKLGEYWKNRRTGIGFGAEVKEGIVIRGGRGIRR